MCNWEAYVRSHLSLPELTPGSEQRIVRELASQLEDFYRDARSQGMSKAQSEAYARRQVRDWTALASEIRRASRAHTRTYLDRWSDRAQAAHGRWTVFADTLQDLRFAARQLRRNTPVTAVTILILALGIGANTALFSVVHTVVLRPLPYPDPGRLVTLWSVEDWPYNTNPPEYFDLRERQRTLDAFAVYTTTGLNLAGDGDPVRVTAAAVSGDFFSVFRLEPALGRRFGPADDLPGKNDVIVLEHGFWQRQLGGDPSVVGRTIILQESAFTVLGVMPAGFSFPDETVDLWVPLGLDSATPPGARTGHWLSSVARLAPGVSLESASEDVRLISRQMHDEHPDAYPQEMQRGWTLRLEPLHASLVGDVRPVLWVLLGAVGVVLLVTCLNVANLLLGRAAARRKEIAVRAVLGASRARVLRLLLTESLVVALCGGAAGLALAVWGLPQLLRFAPASIPRLEEIGLDPQLLLFACALSLATGVVFGVAPAFHAVPSRLNEPLQEGTRGTGSLRARRLRSTLVVAEIALTLVLLAGAGLLLRSFHNLIEVDTGFRTGDILTVQLSLPRTKFSDGESRAAFYGQILERVRSVPGVQAAGAISELPLTSAGSSALMPEGMTPNLPDHFPHGVIVSSGWRIITPGYLEAMDIPLLQGRLFSESDGSDAPRVLIVSDEFARTAWPSDAEFLGKRVAFPTDKEPDWYTVVGVVKNTRSHPNLKNSSLKDAYFSFAQMPRASMALAMKTLGHPTALTAAIRAEIAAVDASVPPYDVRSMDDRLSTSIAQPRFLTLLMVLFAAQALVLGSVGLYGVVSYWVNQRVSEIGIRMALGAGRSDVFRLVVGHGLLLAGLGLVLGLAGALAAGRLLRGNLYEVTPTDPLTLVVVSALLLAVTALACCLPARRATRVDPLTCLRYE